MTTAIKAKFTTDEIQLRRDFTQKLNLRRQVYRELTSYHVFPLQEMAMKDLHKRLDSYLATDRDSESDNGKVHSRHDSYKSSSVGSEESISKAAASSTSTASTKRTNDTTNDLQCLREQFMREFLREKAFPSISFSINSSMSQDHSTSQVGTYKCGHQERGVTHPTPPQSVGDLTQNKEEISSTLEPTFLSTLWSMEPRIFALETSGTGKRRYISSNLGRFMDHYWRECDVYNRHYYELIRENTPCRLYFGEL